ncbi:arsenate reductase ArsC [Methanoplanus sp. FWC-SCC4]|uniref:Arsenate reductase ArsC n=1 Tax=Methanochimaera problematica TaxID=2609417 RepID=A0AA97FCW2_9EURY|nr:arsenate reductase ArsC [Methanoplanus sp. FWC-SCC4]WOF16629.1 arsenate reductase ArsC [Methanoplanus sp. FWC-SCC4]
MKKKVLFVCTHNSARSQMAEGYLNARYGDRFEAFSAGSNPAFVNPVAIEVMRDAGIDISSHYSKNLEEFLGVYMDVVVTVCDSANESCPVFSLAKKKIHAGFTDPFAFSGSEDEVRDAFLKVRDEIFAFIDFEFGDD